MHCTTENAMRCTCVNPCFFQTIAYLKQERRTANMFEGDPQQPGDDLGLTSRDDFFRDGH
ncbi:hypothetical protein PPS11_07980 [Pseudomonas putida S11]|nr:hypothetical protein PPS11_07980 [Pseudomonas putida S11]